MVWPILLALLPVTWWLFGWRTEDNPTLGILTDHRFFGRVTVRTVDSDRDGRADGRYTYRWTRPATTTHAAPIAYEEDRNGDGRMDVWVTELGPNAGGEAEHRFDVDTDGDGRPDWSFKTLDTLSGYEAVVQLRGW